MKVLIPAAGLGTRLRPHTHHRPKPLVHVAGNTVLGHVLDKLEGLDIDEVVFIVGHLGSQIEEYVQSRYRFEARFVVQEELLGQAHAIMLAREYISGPLFVIFVDTIFEGDLAGLADEPGDGVIYVHEVADPSRFGVVTVREDGCIGTMVEKPSEPVSNLALVGLYYLRDGKRLLGAIDDLIESDSKTKGEFYLADALQALVNDGACLRTRRLSVWEDCGTRPALLRANRYLLDQLEGSDVTLTGNSVVIQPSQVSADSQLVRSVVGPHVHIGPECRVEDSVIGPYVSLDREVEITSSILADTIVERGSTISGAGISASLIGVNAVIRESLRQMNVGDHSEVDLAGTGDGVPSGPSVV